MSLVRQNFHEECEAGINRQINMELKASYLYLAMSQHFDREDVALPGFKKFFAKASEEEREHAIKVSRRYDFRYSSLAHALSMQKRRAHRLSRHR